MGESHQPTAANLPTTLFRQGNPGPPQAAAAPASIAGRITPANRSQLPNKRADSNRERLSSLRMAPALVQQRNQALDKALPLDGKHRPSEFQQHPRTVADELVVPACVMIQIPAATVVRMAETLHSHLILAERDIDA